MQSEWREMPLGEAVNLKRGYDLPQQARHSGPTPVVSSSGITDYHRAARIQGPAVVTGRYGTIGSVFYVDGPCWPLNTTLYVQDFKANHPRFIYYMLKTLNYRAYSDKAAVPGINRNHLHTARVLIPDFDEQARISATLASLDTQIEALHGHNVTLEALARTIFKSWFVDFDPVRAKAEGSEPDGMDAATAALFPRQLDLDSTWPVGWQRDGVSRVVKQEKSSVTPAKHPEESFDYYSLPAFDDGKLPKPEKGGAIKSNKLLVSAGAVLLSKLNPHIPRVWFPEVGSTQRSICSTEFLVLKATNRSSAEYIFCQLTEMGFHASLRGLVTGTSNSHQRIDVEALMTTSVLVPPQTVLHAFTSLVKPLLQRVQLNLRQANTLADLRDTLLPRLISGKLRIPEAEKLVASAL